MFHRTFFVFAAALTVSGSALAADCSQANRGLLELKSLTNDLTGRIETLKARHQQLKDAELCQIATRLKQAVVDIHDGIGQGCVSSEDASTLKGKLEEVEAAADSMIGQACKAP
jgi:capsule polysaccharide export protein KpsE/RkpR